jgi:hypothetical protein
LIAGDVGKLLISWRMDLDVVVQVTTNKLWIHLKWTEFFSSLLDEKEQFIFEWLPGL